MSETLISTLHAGLNLKDDPLALADGATEICIGADLTVEGIIQTAEGFAEDTLAASLKALITGGSTGNYTFGKILYMNDVRYCLITTSAGIYSNGILISTAITNKFEALSIGSNIYITDGTTSLRFDGTTAYQWGITGPSVIPDIAAIAQSTKIVESFEDTTDWLTSDVNCTASDEGTIKMDGSHSLQVDVVGAQVASVQDLWASHLNLSVYANGKTAREGDLFEIWVYVTDLTKITSLTFMFDVGDETFTKDFYKHSCTLTETNVEAIVSPAVTGSLEVSPDVARILTEGTIAPSTQVVYTDSGAETSVESYTDKATLVGATATKWQIGGEFNITPVTPTARRTRGTSFLSNNITLTSSLMSNAWCKVQFSKSQFTKMGESGDWSEVKGLKIQIVTTGNVTLYFDTMTMLGGGELSGEYYFMYGWGRQDAYGNVVAYSPPGIDASGNLLITGPITFKQQGVSWGARIASSDPQVNCCIIYIAGGTLTDWWVGYVIPDNATSSGDASISESQFFQRMISRRSFPAPAGNSMVFWKNRVWMIDGTNLVRCSEISPYGDVMVESWPVTNAFSFIDQGGNHLSIHEINRQLVVRSEDGEWAFDLSDPLDISTIQANKSSSSACIGVRAVLEMPSSLIYPAMGSFIETTGSAAKAVLPEASTVISFSGMENAVGVFQSFDGYFSFTDPSGEYIIARVDLLTGKARISYHAQLEFSVSCFMLDRKEGKTYLIYNKGTTGGYMYLFNSGYTQDAEASEFKVRTKKYSLGKDVAWMRLKFYHNLAGEYFVVRALVDEKEVDAKYFSSTVRTEEEFHFGPVTGNAVQFQFEGMYYSLAKLFLPMTIYANG